ncbi:MAG: excinuclease ABC subunit UvrC, partial [Thermoproteota archaeon]|nr:excinuclease ABC subunit UvrC [Thermoproteota archaeon]
MTKFRDSNQVPLDPGVYLMKDNEGNIIYIGKAKNLRKRVLSYFSHSGSTTHNEGVEWKTKKLVARVSDVEFVTTENEIEAFLLESNLIKRYRPLFNIELKDQQRYTYLKLTQETFPRLLVARRNRRGEFSGPKGKIYGPFVKGSSKFLTVGLLRKLFKVRTCNALPKMPCLQYFIKNCDAPCIKNVTESQYLKSIESLQEILSGKNSVEKFTKQMEEDMKSASALLQYEKAKEIHDTLRRLNNLRIKQNMERVSYKNAYEEEYVGIIRDEAKGNAHLIILTRKNGVIMDRKKFDFELVGDNSLGTFLTQYYSSVPAIPRYIYVNELPESKDTIEASLEKLCGHEVTIIRITESFHNKEKKDIMNLVLRNLHLAHKLNLMPLLELKHELELRNTPSVIDCFDISNFGTTFAVGSRTRFVDGKPSKEGYRRFKIRTISGQNDIAMISEIVGRSYSSLSNKDTLPDLIVIDGGRGQLRSALSAIDRLGLDINCISLAKEKEEVYIHPLKKPIRLPKTSGALKVLQHIRDEAH